MIYLEGANVIGIDYVTDNSSAHRLASAGTGYNWVNIEGEEVTSIPAGTTATTVVYKNNKTVHYARFVDINGMLVYEEQFDPNNPVITGNPQPPSIPGYIGSWEPDYMKKLQGATADVIIHPVYTVSSSDVILGETNINDVLDKLSDGETAVLGSNLQGSAGNRMTAAVTMHRSRVVQSRAALVKPHRAR